MTYVACLDRGNTGYKCIHKVFNTDDGTIKGSGETAIGTFRHHEVTDGSVISIVYPMNVQYLLLYATLDYTNIKYVTFGILQPTGVVGENEVKMQIKYEDTL